VSKNFEAVWSVSCCRKDSTVLSVQLLFGTFFEVLSSKRRSYSGTDLARVSKQIIVGLLDAVSGILLLETVTCYQYTFLKLIKSLSLWVSPHWDFPWLVA
jgi:hypothetical protein